MSCQDLNERLSMKDNIIDLRPCTRRARLGGRTALGPKRSYQNGWLPEEKKLKHNVVWENLLFVHILTFSVRFSTNDRNSEFSVLSTQLIGDASNWNWRSSTSWKFADILIEHARLERALSYYEKRAPKNQLHQRPRLISHGSCFGEKGREKKIA